MCFAVPLVCVDPRTSAALSRFPAWKPRARGTSAWNGPTEDARRDAAPLFAVPSVHNECPADLHFPLDVFDARKVPIASASQEDIPLAFTAAV